MSEILEKRIEEAKRTFAKHVLTEELRTEKYVAFYLHDPERGRINSVRIIFTPEGCALVGDHTPERYGTASCFGIGEDFFAAPRGENYLAQKFLSQRWVPELCKEALEAELLEHSKRRAEGDTDAWTLEQQAELRDYLNRFDGNDQKTVYEDLMEIFDEYSDEGPPGWDYDPLELACLVAIQHRFAELYQPEVRKWREQSERYRKLIEGSMAKYSQKLGWGLTGAQEECWAMLDFDVERLVLLERELPALLTAAEQARTVLARIRGIRSKVVDGRCVPDHDYVTPEMEAQEALAQLLGSEPFKSVTAKFAAEHAKTVKPDA